MPQRFDGIEAGGLAGREIAEHDAHRRGKDKGKRHDFQVEQKGHVQGMGAGQRRRTVPEQCR